MSCKLLIYNIDIDILSPVTDSSCAATLPAGLEESIFQCSLAKHHCLGAKVVSSNLAVLANKINKIQDIYQLRMRVYVDRNASGPSVSSGAKGIPQGPLQSSAHSRVAGDAPGPGRTLPISRFAGVARHLHRDADKPS